MIGGVILKSRINVGGGFIRAQRTNRIAEVFVQPGWEVISLTMLVTSIVWVQVFWPLLFPTQLP